MRAAAAFLAGLQVTFPNAGDGVVSVWCSWNADDPRWRVRVIDTSGLRIEEVAEHLIDWIEEERNAVREHS